MGLKIRSFFGCNNEEAFILFLIFILLFFGTDDVC